MSRKTAPHPETDGGRDWPLGLVNLVDEHGHVPLVEAVDESDVDEDVLDALRTLHQNAREAAVSVDELLLELKRINSVLEGIPNEADIREWDGASVQQYEAVFKSVENAVEFALACKSGDLMLAIDEYYQQNEPDDE